ncbi:TM0106 family RecB-like putative nuclease [Nocardioides sp.]|uniref:TM0106 family RecB-like putative nuclease n=1 Tax=Nocardioides sp. TaxID=35761 RepID=UPI0027331BDA|nr:TM0106 family RecB-like putative nuclease [Nocardioides sp.]MDP3894083.1 TM0106 family RecB-like putative nuclease [Nocardioides sp.]
MASAPPGPIVLLDGHASKRCVRRVHNDHDATIPRGPWEVPPELQARFDAGLAFESGVLDALAAALGDACLRVDETLTRKQRIEATLDAMRGGVPVVVGGQLPDDPVGGRVGRPDLLLRWSAAGGPPAYLPADVKGHRTAKASKKGTLRVSTLAEPTTLLELDGRVEVVSGRLDDFLQLAHYTRMLQACGLHPGEGSQLGAIIGTDDLGDVDPSGHALVWHDLTVPWFTTFSRSQGTAARSALERYDHEHEFRVKVAAVAARRTGSPTDPAPLVVPVWQAECGLCPWSDHCADQLGPDDPSVAITSGRLDVREWLALRDLGITTTTALAELEPDEAFTATYLAQVSHQTKALDRLAIAIDRARMIRDGVLLRSTSPDPVEVPRADVEIDLDIEWDVDDRVYLWGARLRRGQGAATYHPFVRWEPLDDASERALAEEFTTWLRGVVSTAESAGETVMVVHHAAPEPTYLRRILGPDRVADLLDHFVDLLTFLRRHYVGVHGLGIKKVAPGFGFDWRDEDPGGLQSQGWLVAARAEHDSAERRAARERVLAYNEDDVAATAAVRDGLRRHAAEHPTARDVLSERPG